MTNPEYHQEQLLRALMVKERSAAVASVLADFYEQRQQLTRAKMWRDAANARDELRRRVPDLTAQSVQYHRKSLMWLLAHCTKIIDVARLFKSSPSWASVLIHEVETQICEAANMERHHPTLAATRRLQIARALPPPYGRGVFRLGETPPESWPLTRACESDRIVALQQTTCSTPQGETPC